VSKLLVTPAENGDSWASVNVSPAEIHLSVAFRFASSAVKMQWEAAPTILRFALHPFKVAVKFAYQQTICQRL
jgi:hypothetical protein